MYTVKYNNKEYQFEDKITLKELSKKLNVETYVATVNNRLRELNFYINFSCTVDFLDLTNFDAVRVYETSLRYLIIMALENLYPHIKAEFNQCVSRSISCNVTGLADQVDAKFLVALEKEMDRLVAADYPIVRKTIPKAEAIEIYKKKGYLDKNEVLKYREEDEVNIYVCDKYVNYLFGYMVPSTGYLNKFKLRLYYPGFLVQFPRAEKGGQIPVFEDSPSFGRMLKEARSWAKMCESDRIPLLNTHASEASVIDLVNMCETKHNNMLAELGGIIKKNIEDIRLICIAGPSSSGKTTFSHRLRIQLMTLGIKPFKISMDDYYLNRDKAPVDEYGEPDLEHVRALDLELFNNNLLALIQGEEVQLPTFDFKLGERIAGPKVRISENTPVIIEGIHALNEEVTKLIPKHQKFKIYISPLSQIKIDDHNPIPATEIRLLRRIVRDAKYRKTHPSATFSMWASVRRGEFKWIYPYQEEADYIFNSELTYELAVMKKYALPALAAIDRNDEYFIAANRLVKFLKYIKDIDDRYVPCNSLLREFIGNSCFYDL
ncbi:MAG TPA: nucleoside kinase [Bacilli bacterium]|nr:nucleoside kinase [Bacilli bacterium]